MNCRVSTFFRSFVATANVFGRVDRRLATGCPAPIDVKTDTRPVGDRGVANTVVAIKLLAFCWSTNKFQVFVVISVCVFIIFFPCDSRTLTHARSLSRHGHSSRHSRGKRFTHNRFGSTSMCVSLSKWNFISRNLWSFVIVFVVVVVATADSPKTHNETQFKSNWIETMIVPNFKFIICTKRHCPRIDWFDPLDDHWFARCYSLRKGLPSATADVHTFPSTEWKLPHRRFRIRQSKQSVKHTHTPTHTHTSTLRNSASWLHRRRCRRRLFPRLWLLLLLLALLVLRVFSLSDFVFSFVFRYCCCCIRSLEWISVIDLQSIHRTVHISFIHQNWQRINDSRIHVVVCAFALFCRSDGWLRLLDSVWNVSSTNSQWNLLSTPTAICSAFTVHRHQILILSCCSFRAFLARFICHSLSNMC